MHFDVIIIGMGLSGLMAAKTAVEMGKKVLIIGKGLGTLSIFSNTVDILGILPPTTKMKDGLSQWIKDHPDHPYGKVGLEKIDESLSAFITLFPPPYSFQAIGETNCFIPTGAGTLRPAYLIPATMMAGESLKGGDGLIVGFKGFKDFFATQVAKPFKCRGLMVSLPDSSHEIKQPPLC
jgi:glycerol-3-phosphate dehydrogenase subunit B